MGTKCWWVGWSKKRARENWKAWQLRILLCLSCKSPAKISSLSASEKILSIARESLGGVREAVRRGGCGSALSAVTLSCCAAWKPVRFRGGSAFSLDLCPVIDVIEQSHKEERQNLYTEGCLNPVLHHVLMYLLSWPLFARCTDVLL